MYTHMEFLCQWDLSGAENCRPNFFSPSIYFYALKKLIFKKKVITQGIPVFTVISFPLLQIGLGAFPLRLPKFLYFRQGGAIYIEEYHSSLPLP